MEFRICGKTFDWAKITVEVGLNSEDCKKCREKIVPIEFLDCYTSL